MTQRYLPGKERKSPYYLELILHLPPHSITKISIDMDYLFLKWQEYPPDANHGFYMGPAIVTALLPIARNYTALPLDGSTITSRFVSFYLGNHLSISNIGNYTKLIQTRIFSFVIINKISNSDLCTLKVKLMMKLAVLTLRGMTI